MCPPANAPTPKRPIAPCPCALPALLLLGYSSHVYLPL